MFSRSTHAVTLAVGIGAALALAPAPAQAAPDPSLGPNCDTVLWGFLGSQRRTVCDGPIRADGSWGRKRSIWTPPHNVPVTCHTYGGSSYSSTTCSGGYFVPFSIDDQEDYPVTPDTVLPDEPGHLPAPAAVPQGRTIA